MRVYLAAPWIHRAEARQAREKLTAAGYDVNSRWLDVDETTTSPEVEAVNDMTDILSSDALVVLNLAKSEGKACETGMAIVAGMPVISVGDGHNIFLKLPTVRRVETLHEAITILDHLTTQETPCPSNC
jgi:nucleoside 2-deoxyribosyltransferase